MRIIIKLYYFDFDLRNIFIRYISRIEVNLRTTLVYYVSNFYKEYPFWHVDPNIINETMINSAEYSKALKDISLEKVIIKDKLNYDNREYAPAWKSLEFMSLGTIIKLYNNLKNPQIKCKIANVYKMEKPSQFYNYIETVRRLRNSCAHAKVLYDLRLTKGIGNGPLKFDNIKDRTNLMGTYNVLKYFLSIISNNRVIELKAEMLKAFDRIPYNNVINIIEDKTGISIEKL